MACSLPGIKCRLFLQKRERYMIVRINHKFFFEMNNKGWKTWWPIKKGSKFMMSQVVWHRLGGVKVWESFFKLLNQEKGSTLQNIAQTLIIIVLSWAELIGDVKNYGSDEISSQELKSFCWQKYSLLSLVYYYGWIVFADFTSVLFLNLLLALFSSLAQSS